MIVTVRCFQSLLVCLLASYFVSLVLIVLFFFFFFFFFAAAVVVVCLVCFGLVWFGLSFQSLFICGLLTCLFYSSQYLHSNRFSAIKQEASPRGRLTMHVTCPAYKPRLTINGEWTPMFSTHVWKSQVDSYKLRFFFFFFLVGFCSTS